MTHALERALIDFKTFFDDLHGKTWAQKGGNRWITRQIPMKIGDSKLVNEIVKKVYDNL